MSESVHEPLPAGVRPRDPQLLESDFDLQQRLVQAQKMDLVGQLTAGIVHDFNNLLMAMDGYLALALANPACDPGIREDLEQARRCGDRAGAVSRRLLSFSRPGPPVREPLRLDLLVRETADLLRPLIGENIRVVQAVGDASGHTVLGDRGQIEQALMNLVINARDAMPEGGILSLAAYPVQLDETFTDRFRWARAGDYICVEVRDSGKGIPPEVQERLFDPFVSGRTGNGGHGLGLSIVYSVVKNHRGYVHFESRPESGTAFWIYLRACTERGRKEAVMGSEPLASSDAVGKSVLIVEDEQVVRDLAATALSGLGYRILLATDAEEANQVFLQEKGRIDLLFTDLVLPGASGAQLAEGLRVEHPGLRVLYTTGYGEESLPEGFGDDDLASFIQKPYALKSLAETVRGILG